MSPSAISITATRSICSPSGERTEKLVQYLRALEYQLGRAAGRVTAGDGTPIGSGLYTFACFVGIAAVLAVLYTGRRRAPTTLGPLPVA